MKRVRFVNDEVSLQMWYGQAYLDVARENDAKTGFIFTPSSDIVRKQGMEWYKTGPAVSGCDVAYLLYNSTISLVGTPVAALSAPSQLARVSPIEALKIRLFMVRLEKWNLRASPTILVSTFLSLLYL